MMLELSPEEERQLKLAARGRGVEPEEVAREFAAERLPGLASR